MPPLPAGNAAETIIAISYMKLLSPKTNHSIKYITNVLRTLSNIQDGAFPQKQLTVCTR